MSPPSTSLPAPASPLAATPPARRCHLEGCGVPRDVARAAELFRAAGSTAELRELALLKAEFAALELPELPGVE